MKSNFFKIVLPAFALMLAITASLAFTPAEDAVEITTAYYDDLGECVQVSPVSCQVEEVFGMPCEITINTKVERLYKDSVCTILLYKYIEE